MQYAILNVVLAFPQRKGQSMTTTGAPHTKNCSPS